MGLVTTEYITEYGNGGGLGNYLARLTSLIQEAGHECEVFVLSDRDETLQHGGVRVQRVSRNSGDSSWGHIRRLLKRLRIAKPLYKEVVPTLQRAWALGRAVRRREREAPFDLIQSADYQAAGLFVKRSRRRPHVIRCSLAADLWSETDGVGDRKKWVHRLERWSIRRADYAYAPSQFVADYFQQRFGLRVGVVRPPVAMEISASREFPGELPDRFFIHFGQIIRRKGSDVLAQALPCVWERAPEFRMVWAGGGNAEEIGRWMDQWGARRNQVTWLGALEKRDLYAVLQRSEAAVLPSLVDNLPNTVIESLLLDKPVIGSRGASIDEIVRDGENGILVPPGDAAGLAEAILRVWRGEVHWQAPLMPKSPIYAELNPENAIQNLLSLRNVHGASRGV